MGVEVNDEPNRSRTMAQTWTVNPTLESVNETLAAYAAEANRGQRVRLAELTVTPAEWAEREGCYWNGGESVANSYRGRATATLVSVAWLTVAGRRIVRFYGARIEAAKSPFGRALRGAFGLTEKQTEKASHDQLVFPIGATNAIELLGFKPDTLPGIAADYADEHGFPLLAQRLRTSKMQPAI
jgi:hypothetical protein